MLSLMLLNLVRANVSAVACVTCVTCSTITCNDPQVENKQHQLLLCKMRSSLAEELSTLHDGSAAAAGRTLQIAELSSADDGAGGVGKAKRARLDKLKRSLEVSLTSLFTLRLSIPPSQPPRTRCSAQCAPHRVNHFSPLYHSLPHTYRPRSSNSPDSACDACGACDASDVRGACNACNACNARDVRAACATCASRDVRDARAACAACASRDARDARDACDACNVPDPLDVPHVTSQALEIAKDLLEAQANAEPIRLLGVPCTLSAISTIAAGCVA